jgi:hypothetical protein
MKDSTEFPLVIVGKNSKLYGYYSQAIKKRFKVGIELSHIGINSIPTDSNVVLFSFDRKSLEANLKLVSVISNRIRGKLIYISTSAVFANIYTTRYLYPKLKGDIEINVLNNHANTVIVRVVCRGGHCLVVEF